MTEPRPDTVRLQGVMKGFWESAALMSGVELGLFTAISEGHDTVEAAAGTMDIAPVNAERLMTALTAMGLIERDGDRFRNAPDVERFLVQGKSSYAGPWMLFGKPRWDGWGRLTELLRQPVAPNSGITPTASPTRGRKKYQGRDGLFHEKTVRKPERYSR